MTGSAPSYRLIMHRIALSVLALMLAAASVAGCSDDESTTLLTGGTGGVGGSPAGGGTGAVGGHGAGCAYGLPCGLQQECCAQDEECVNDMQCLPVCEHERCGENLTQCCAAGQICLDGVVCAADCGTGEALCGASLETCCDPGDVCLADACVTPGDTCDNDFDCLQDGWYCEATIGRCLPLPTGPLCEGEPEFNPVEPTLEWYWPGVDYNGLTYQNVIAAPTVGDVNGDGTPDVVVVVYAGADGNHTLIAVLDGDGDGSGHGELLFTIPSAADPTAPEPFWVAAVALANFDGDPGLEIVYNLRAAYASPTTTASAT